MCDEVYSNHSTYNDTLSDPTSSLLMVGSTRSFYCNEGYALIGNSQLECLASPGSPAYWSSQPPECKSM